MNSEKTQPQCFFGPKKYLRMLFPKSSTSSSSLSSWLLSLLNNFESSLTERLKKLTISQNKDEILTLSWMILAMESLCETHNDLNILITDLKLPSRYNSKDSYWVDIYMDITAKMLDLCNGFSSELNCINRCIFDLKCLRHNEEQFIEIRSTLDHWSEKITAKNTEIGTILDGFVESLDFPKKKKNFPKAKVFMKAFYATNVLTVYICSVFVTIFSNSDKTLDMSRYVSRKQSSWKKNFLDLQNVVNAKIRDVLSYGGTMVLLNELECVDAKVRKIYLMIKDGDVLVQESFKNSIVELKEEVEILVHGLDELSGKNHNLFSVTLKGRCAIDYGL